MGVTRGGSDPLEFGATFGFFNPSWGTNVNTVKPLEVNTPNCEHLRIVNTILGPGERHRLEHKGDLRIVNSLGGPTVHFGLS